MFFLNLLFTTMASHAQELPFDQALKAMVDENVNVRIQRTKLSASESQVNAARGAFTPTLSLQAQQQNSDGNGPTAVAVYPTAQLYTANATWNIFRSGADVAGLRAALMDRAYQTSLLDDNYLRAEDQAARALLDLIAKQQLVEVYRRSETSVHHFLEIAQARFAKSLLSREEAEKIALDAANAEAKRADAEIQAESARAGVDALLGHSHVKAEWPWAKNLEQAQVKKLLAKQAKDALDSRPDLEAAHASLDSEDFRSRSFFRAMLPTIDLNYSVGETHLRGQTISAWSSLATLTIPIWSGLHDYSAYKVQVENKYAADFRLRQLERDVQSSVESAQSIYLVSLQQYQVRTRNLGIAKHIMDQDALRFKMGRTGADELNLDLGRMTEAEILAIQGVAQVHLAYMQLLHAFGKKVQ